MLSVFYEQPRAFRMIFMLELWERFGYYTVQGILTLYFIRFLGFDETKAYYTFGAFAALVYGLVALGGYVGDRILGTKRTLVLGLIVLALGYLSLAFANASNVFWSLAVICVGSGLFKANPANLLSKCYGEQDPRLHSGFTLYYMAVNLGSIGSLLLGPAVAAHFGYKYAYFLSFIGLLLALANYFWQKYFIDNINNAADQAAITWMRWLLVVMGILVLTSIAVYLLQHVVLARNLVLLVIVVAISIYLSYMRLQDKHSRLRMLIALLLMFEAVSFFVLYHQMPTSLTLFAVNNVMPVVFGMHIDPQSLQALNPIWIIILSPILAKIYTQQKNLSFTITYKFAFGMLFCAISFLVLYFAKFYANEQGVVSAWWLVASYGFQGLAELLVSALGLAMIAELVPQKITGFVMGMWFLTSAISGFIGAKVASYTALPKTISIGMESLVIYTDVFMHIGVVSFIIGVLMLFIAWLINSYSRNYMIVC